MSEMASSPIYIVVLYLFLMIFIFAIPSGIGLLVAYILQRKYMRFKLTASIWFVILHIPIPIFVAYDFIKRATLNAWDTYNATSWTTTISSAFSMLPFTICIWILGVWILLRKTLDTSLDGKNSAR